MEPRNRKNLGLVRRTRAMSSCAPYLLLLVAGVIGSLCVPSLILPKISQLGSTDALPVAQDWEHHASALALALVNHSASDPWISLWRRARGRTLSPPACVPRPASEAEESRFLSRNSVFEARPPGGGQLCTVTNGFEFALRYRLDQVQHPRPPADMGGDLDQGGTADEAGQDFESEVNKWKSTAKAARLGVPSCRYAGSIRTQSYSGWGAEWFRTGMHLAEAALIFNQPTVVLPPSKGKYLYAPDSPDCPANDWTCFVHPLTSCDAGRLGQRNWTAGGEWRAGYSIDWMNKYLREARLADPRLLEVWDEVVRDLGGDWAGIRGLAMIARAWATRPLPRTQGEARSVLRGQGLDGDAGIEGCVAIHMRRSDNRVAKGRPVFGLGPMVEAAKVPPGGGRRVLLLSDTEIDAGELGAVDGLPWTMLRRHRGAAGRGFHDHLPTSNATLEVAYIYAEQELASRCTRMVYQQGAFAGMLWDGMCRRHGGWPTCIDELSKTAMCDYCCPDMKQGTFNLTDQTCNGNRIPGYVCIGRHGFC